MMKGILKWKTAIALVCILACFSCKKKWERYNKGEATALKNGTEWRAHVTASELSGRDNHLNIFLRVYNTHGYEIESMRFLIMPWQIGTFDLNRSVPGSGFPILPIANYGTSHQDGHITCDYYYLDTTAAKNYLTITSYNSKSGKIEGEFELSVEIDPPKLGPSPQEAKCDPQAPDLITFTKGKFWGYVEE